MQAPVVQGNDATTFLLPPENNQSNQTSGNLSLTSPVDLNGRSLGNWLAEPFDVTFQLPPSPRKPLQDYLISEIPNSTRNALRDWVEKVLVNHYLSSPRSDVMRSLSVFNTLFHERNNVFNKGVRDKALTGMRALLKIVVPIIQNSTKLGLEHLARVLGGIGLIPESLLSEEFKGFLLDQILSPVINEKKASLAKLDGMYLIRMVFGLQNFQVTEASEEKLQMSLKLIADAYNKNRRNHTLSMEDAEVLSAGLQNFQSICPPKLLEIINTLLDNYISSDDSKVTHKAVYIVRNLQGYGSETTYTPKILEKATAIIEANLKYLTPALIAQALTGLAAHAHKSEKIRDAFNKLLQHQYNYLTAHTTEIITIREFIFACQLYQLRTRSRAYTDEIETLKELIPQNCKSKPVYRNVDDEIKRIISECVASSEPIDLKKNFYWNKFIEFDYYWKAGALDIEVNGPIHDTAAKRVRDELRKELLKHHGIEVIELDFGGLQSGDQERRKRIWNKFKGDIKEKYEAARVLVS